MLAGLNVEKVKSDIQELQINSKTYATKKEAEALSNEIHLNKQVLDDVRYEVSVLRELIEKLEKSTDETKTRQNKELDSIQ